MRYMTPLPRKNNISVISISYGNPELDPNSLWTQMGVKLTDQAFEAAAALGITICCSSGDDGSSDEGTGKAEWISRHPVPMCLPWAVQNWSLPKERSFPK